MKTIKVRIPRRGIASGKSEVTIDAEGFVGQQCKDVTAAFMQLGSEVQVEDKPELYQSTGEQQYLSDGE